jgi:hypothetical protein
MATLTDTDWDSRFTMVPPENGDTYWPIEALREDGQIPENRLHNVWTVIEADFDLYIVPGYHFVNRFNGRDSYIVTAEQWTEADLDNEWVW